MTTTSNTSAFTGLNHTQREQIEAHRVTWRRIARIHKWETTPLYITIWIDGDNVIDSVSYRGLDQDVLHIIEQKKEETI